MTYRVADGGRVTDQAQQVRVDEVSVAATFLALTLAADRFGDRPLVVTGTEAFKAQLALLAVMEGMKVSFADPAMEAERQRHVEAAHARHAQQPSIAVTTEQSEPGRRDLDEERRGSRAWQGSGARVLSRWPRQTRGSAASTGGASRRNLLYASFLKRMIGEGHG
jgi:hypothetical protein